MTTFEKLQKITELLPQIINTSVHAKIRRNQVNAGVCRVLKIPRSNENVKLIRAVLKAIGIREVVIRGRSFYVSYADANPANRAKVRAKNADKKA